MEPEIEQPDTAPAEAPVEAPAEAVTEAVAAETPVDAGQEKAVAAAANKPILEFNSSSEDKAEYELYLIEQISEEVIKDIVGTADGVVGKLELTNENDGVTEVINLWVAPVGTQEKLLNNRYKISSTSKFVCTRIIPGNDVPTRTVYDFFVLQLSDGANAVANIDARSYINIKLPSSIPVAYRDKVKSYIIEFGKAIGKLDKLVVKHSLSHTMVDGDTDNYILEVCGSFTPISNTRYTAPSTAFGINTGPAKTLGFVPSLDAQPIFDSEGVEVGCYNNSGICCYLVQTFTEDTVEILRRFLGLAVDIILNKRPDDLQEVKNRYIKYVSSTASRVVKEKKQELQNIVAELRDVQRNYMDLLTQESELTRFVYLLESDDSTYSKLVAEDFDRIMKMRQVKSVYWRGQAFCLSTNMIHATDPRTGHVHEIGEFTIVMDSLSGEPRWFNCTRRVDGMRERQMAPHVWKDGTACLGNIGGSIQKLIATRRYYQASMVMVSFVESVNQDHDEAGRHVHRWPISKLKPGVGVLDGSGKVLDGA